MSARRGWRSACAAGLLLLLAGLAFGADKTETMAKDDARALFAHALGVPVAAVSGFASQSLAAWEPGAELWWGVVTVDSADPQPMLVLQRLCKSQGKSEGKSGPCTVKPLRLPLGTELRLLALLDLNGLPATVNLIDPAPASAALLQPQASGKPGAPAALLRVRQRLDSGEQRSTLVLASLGSVPALVWREVDASIAVNGGGYRSHQLALLRSAGAGWLQLELGQTSLPPAGQQPQMPGPPLALRFSAKGAHYQRVR